MKKIFSSIVIIILIINILLINFSTLTAKDITDFADTSDDYFTNLYEISGTKSSGMGETFVAIADDPSTAYLNPAGLYQLKKRELYVTFPSFVFVFPYPKLTFALYLQELANHTYTNSYKDRASIINCGAPVSIPILSWFYFGLSINFLLKTRTINYSLIPAEDNNYHNEDEISEMGYGGSLWSSIGMLFKPLSNIDFGFILKNKNEIKWSSHGPEYDSRYPTTFTPLIPEPISITGSDTLPSSMGFGVAMKLLPNLLLSIDIVQKRWSEAKRNEKDKEINPGLKDVTEIHIGSEFIPNFIKKKIPIRFGFYVQPDYIVDEINEEQRFLTFGTGYQFKHFGFDIAIRDSGLLSSGHKKVTERDIALFYKW